MKTSRAAAFFRNAVILCLTSVLLRGIGVAFSSYISGKLGAEGMGLLSLINSVYSLAVTFSLSGINLAASRLTAEAIGRGEENRVGAVMLRCGLYGLVFGTLSCLTLLSLSGFVSDYFLRDVRAASALRYMAFGLPALSVTSALGGYFSAVRRVIKSAAAQLFEQLFRIAATVTLIRLLPGGGIERTCTLVSASVMLSELAVLSVSYFSYRLDLRKHGLARRASGKNITGSLLKIALPVAFSSYIRSGLITAEQLLIPWGLKKYGASQSAALAGYGALHGMALPIVLFPQAFLSAFSGLLVPEIAEFRVRGEYDRIRYAIGRVFQITLWFSVGVSGLLLCFSHELGTVIYHEREAGVYIRMLAPLIPVMYLDSAVDSVLKGMNEQLYSMRVNVTDALLSVMLVLWLIPELGIKGYVITIYASELLNTSLSISRLLQITDFKVRLFRWLALPLISSVGACTLARLILYYSGILFRYELPELIIKLALGALIYLTLLLITGSVSRADIQWFRKAVMNH